jgi:hypothetical protein
MGMGAKLMNRMFNSKLLFLGQISSFRLLRQPRHQICGHCSLPFDVDAASTLELEIGIILDNLVNFFGDLYVVLDSG